MEALGSSSLIPNTAKTEIAQRKISMMRTSGVWEHFPKKAGNRLETFHIAEERT